MHIPSSGTCYYSSLKKHKYILIHSCSLSEISLNLGLKHVTQCYMTLKYCVEWCSSFVCDIEKHNRMYQNKIKLVLFVREISFLRHLAQCTVQNKIIWTENRFCGRQFCVKFLFFLYVSALKQCMFVDSNCILTFCPICWTSHFLLKSNFYFRFFTVVSLLHICQCLLVEKERIVLFSDDVSGEDCVELLVIGEWVCCTLR